LGAELEIRRVKALGAAGGSALLGAQAEAPGYSRLRIDSPGLHGPVLVHLDGQLYVGYLLGARRQAVQDQAADIGRIAEIHVSAAVKIDMHAGLVVLDRRQDQALGLGADLSRDRVEFSGCEPYADHGRQGLLNVHTLSARIPGRPRPCS
jgi:hypothetical protein